VARRRHRRVAEVVGKIANWDVLPQICCHSQEYSVKRLAMPLLPVHNLDPSDVSQQSERTK
jgi:hypothetical protein